MAAAAASLTKLLAPAAISTALFCSTTSGSLSFPRLKPRVSPIYLRRHHNSKSSSSVIKFSTTTAPATSTISVGDKLPESTLSYIDSAGKLQTVTVSDLTKGKKAILFGVPGAFTPTSSKKHLPGFVEKAGELKAKGVDTIACISVNDAFVMKAWKENLSVGDDVLMLSDGNGEFTRALGVEFDPTDLEVRSRRYALLAEDGIVKVLNLEEGGAFTFSSAQDMLKAL